MRGRSERLGALVHMSLNEFHETIFTWLGALSDWWLSSGEGRDAVT